jgi:glycogen debranching enzyme
LNTDKLLKSAKEILEKNWNGRFTIASPTLYPHQWSWDSCFIAIGKSYFNVDQATKELESLFSAQWKNGMIPHIVFDESKKTYFPTSDFYDITRSENAPKSIGTSGMTQPPVHSIASYYIYENAQDKAKAKEFLKKAYPKLMSFHRYLMTDRDPEKSGLVTILHPWESGLDNSPTWDEPLSRIQVKEEDLPKFERLDIIAVGGAAETRTSQWMYNRFIYLIELMKAYEYNEKKMYQTFPFKVKDIVFSSIFYVANKFLMRIANIVEEEKEEQDIHEIREWMSRTEQNFYKYFFPSNRLRDGKMGSNEESLFYDYDLIKKDWIKRKTISSLIPIYTGLLPKEDAEVILRWITHAHFCGEDSYCHTPTIPSTDLEVSYFKPMTYWRGPVWINTNWMIWLGMLKYGYKKEAELIRNGVFELVENHGFREFYDPYKGQGLGGKDFSWSAALVIDMIMNKEIGIPPSSPPY